MKNSKFSLFVATMIFGIISMFLVTTVKAAFAYSWSVNGENLSIDSSNTDGTASWSTDPNYSGGVLTLNNYNGKQLKIDCYGTASDDIFAIKLVGDNKINMPNGVGIIANFPIVFIGDGKLTINAGVPIGSGGFENGAYLTDIDKVKWNTNTTITIEPKTTANTDNSINEDTENNENNEVIAENKEDTKPKKTKASKTKATKKSKNKNTNKNKNILSKISIFDIVLLSYCGVSLIIIITLVIKLKSHKKTY